MALASCPSCSKKISSAATSCPSCGHPLEENWAKVAAELAEKQRKAKEKKSAWTLAVVLLVVGGMVWLSRQSDDGRSANCGSEVEAVTFAQILITKRLKNPDSAEFSYANTRKAMLKCGTWQVSSYVDASNSFGGTVRTNFTAIVRRVGKNRWVLEDLQM